MNPYHIEISNEVGLFQLSDGRFQLASRGTLDPVMVGFKYILVESAIAKYFKGLGIERVSFRSAVVWDRANDIEYTNYEQAIINHHFESEQINDIDLDGKQLLLMDNRYLFVSPDLKSELAKSNYSFKFSEGLANFG